MDIFSTVIGESTVNVPKSTSDTFQMKNNYYVVTDGTTFAYYPIKVKDSQDTEPLIRLDRSPPVILEGVAIVNRKVYHVTVPDLMRRVIRKSREIKQEVIDANSNKRRASTTSGSVDTLVAGSSSTQTVPDQHERRAIEEAEVEITKVADNAWSDQIGTLLDFISQKEGEEWEVTATP